MEQAVLIAIHNDSEIIHLNKSEFSVGRAIYNSYVSKEITISRCHCVFKFENNKWTITDKSSNGTKVNSRSITKHNSYSLENNDIIELTDVIKYKFCYSHNIENVSSKKRRLDDNILSIQSIPNTSNHLSEKSSISLGQQEINSNSIVSNKSELYELKDKLCKETATIKKLKDDSKEMQSKIFGLEVDLFNKIASSVKLEQEIIDLKSSCANLEKEKEELQLQLTEFESETNLLKQRLETSQNINKIKPQLDDFEDEDKKLLCCVLRAEINERECSLKLKMNKAISQLQNLKSPDTSIQQIQDYLTEVQTDIDELTSKRYELENSTKTSEPSCSAGAEKITEDLFNTMETDLQCTICNELFIKSTSLNCGHTFCKMCIQQWRKQKNTCPVCRVPIKSSVPCIALDNYVDQTMEFLSPSKKETRAKLKETHEASTSNLNKNEGHRETIYISLDSDSDSDDSILDEDTEDLSDYSDNYYGGYGACFICGDRDHWANACPRRRRR